MPEIDFSVLLRTEKAKAVLGLYLSDPFSVLTGALLAPNVHWHPLVTWGNEPVDLEDLSLTWDDCLEEGWKPQTLTILDFEDKLTRVPYRVIIVEHQNTILKVLGKYQVFSYCLY
jgi:hypothetical protein